MINALLGGKFLEDGILPTTNDISVLKWADSDAAAGITQNQDGFYVSSPRHTRNPPTNPISPHLTPPTVSELNCKCDHLPTVLWAAGRHDRWQPCICACRAAAGVGSPMDVQVLPNLLLNAIGSSLRITS